MGATIINTRVDIEKSLSKVSLIANDVTTVYTVGPDKVKSLVDINILNKNSVTAKVDIWIGTKNKVPQDIDLLEYNILFDANSVFIRTSVLIGRNEVLYMRSDTDNVIVRVTGLEDRTRG